MYHLHRAPLRKLSRCVRRVYQFDKYPVRKWSVEKERLNDHLQPRPIMALQVDNTIKIGHEPTHKTYALTNGTPLKMGLETRNDALEPEPAEAMLLVECPPRDGDLHPRRLNGHRCGVASL